MAPPTSFLITALCVVLFAAARAEFGPCRFDADKCSCKYDESSQGTCWDRFSGTSIAGLCQKRFCNAGWTCSCGGRSHVCNLAPVVSIVLDNPADSVLSEAGCHDESVVGSIGTDIMLGTFFPQFSKTGMLANQCNQIAWFHNGVLLGNYGSVPGISDSTLTTEMRIRSQHSQLELRPGDLLAFRIREGSYHCYNGLSVLKVNGIDIDTNSDTVQTVYSREHVANWYQPEYNVTLGTDESDSNLWHFLPMRTNFLSGASNIVPGADSWREPDGSEDHKISNFYFRMQL